MSTESKFVSLDLSKIPNGTIPKRVGDSFIGVPTYDLDATEPPEEPGTGSASAWLTGTTVPDGELGNELDFYIRSNGYLYQKQSGTWLILAQLKGEPGSPSEDAVNSVNGKTGEVVLNAEDVGAIATVGGETDGNIPVFDSGQLIDSGASVAGIAGLITAVSESAYQKGGANTKSIEQAAHGLTVDQFVTVNGDGLYEAAQGDAEVVGWVIESNTDDFLMALPGSIGPNPASALGTYWLSDSIAGGFTDTPPSVPIKRKLFVALSDTEALFVNELVSEGDGGGGDSSTNLLADKQVYGYTTEALYSELTDGDTSTTRGLGAGPSDETALKFEFLGTVSIKKLRIYVVSHNGDSNQIHVLAAHNGDSLGFASVADGTENEWLEINFDSPIEFSPSQPLWIQPSSGVTSIIGEIQAYADSSFGDYIDLPMLDIAPAAPPASTGRLWLRNNGILFIQTPDGVSTVVGMQDNSVHLNYVSDGDANGVFYWFGTQGYSQSWANPHTAGDIEVTASSDLFGTGVATIVDRTDNVFHSANDGSGNYIRFDLKTKILKIKGYSFQNRADADATIPTRIVVRAKNDGPTWEEIGSYSYDEGLENTGQGQWNYVPISGQETSYRYIEFYAQTATTNTGIISCSEIELYGVLSDA